MTAFASAGLLARLSTYYKDIDLTLRADYWELLQALGNPHLHLPPTIHVAGTNGKGSTVAFMRAIAEAAGLKVHTYISPHLVHIHERIRLAEKLISEDEFLKLLQEIEAHLQSKKLTQFEILTVAAFMAFKRHPADLLLLETGMGGRLDSTNIIPTPIATVITRISHDHAAFLGDDVRTIAAEKAGIFKKNTPAIVGPQTDQTIYDVFIKQAEQVGCPLLLHGRDWHYEITPHGFTLHHGATRYDLPAPSLLGDHQYANAAGAAMALITQQHIKLPATALAHGIAAANWPARLQRLTKGPLVDALPSGWELWLDGGHNDSAGEALATQAKHWEEADTKPLYLIYGMINTKAPEEFLQPLAPYLQGLASMPIPDEDKSLSAAMTAEAAGKLGITPAWAAETAGEALEAIKSHTGNGKVRVLVSGSLYLAGYILRDHG